MGAHLPQAQACQKQNQSELEALAYITIVEKIKKKSTGYSSASDQSSP